MSESTLTLSPKFENHSQLDKQVKSLKPGSRLVIFGAGAFGGWTALMLQERGLSVTLVDPLGPGNSRSSSGGESRIMRMAYGESELFTQLAKRSYHLWELYQKRFGRRYLYPTGNLWLCHEQDDTIAKAVQVLKRNDLPYEELTSTKAQRAFPEMSFEDVGYVLHEKRTGYLMAREATIAVRNYFVRNGGTFLRKSVEVNSVLEDNGRQVRFDDDTSIRFEACIFACGPWLPKLFPEILPKRISVTRQEVYYFGLPEGKAAVLEALPTWIDHMSFYYGISNTAYRGFKVALDVRGDVFDPDKDNRLPTNTKIAAARDFLGKRFPSLKEAPLVESRVCQYSNTRSGNFIFDHHPSSENVYLLGGGSGHGFKHGPGLGEIVANTLLSEKPIPGCWTLTAP